MIEIIFAITFALCSILILVLKAILKRRPKEPFRFPEFENLIPAPKMKPPKKSAEEQQQKKEAIKQPFRSFGRKVDDGKND